MLVHYSSPCLRGWNFVHDAVFVGDEGKAVILVLAVVHGVGFAADNKVIFAGMSGAGGVSTNADVGSVNSGIAFNIVNVIGRGVMNNDVELVIVIINSNGLKGGVRGAKPPLTPFLKGLVYVYSLRKIKRRNNAINVRG